MAALRRPLLILPLLAALAALAPAGAAAASPNVDALLLGATKSPVLSELRDVSDFDATRAADAEAGAPRRYDVLIVDGDRLGTGELGDVGMIERFLDADGFVMVLDAERPRSRRDRPLHLLRPLRRRRRRAQRDAHVRQLRRRRPGRDADRQLRRPAPGRRRRRPARRGPRPQGAGRAPGGDRRPRSDRRRPHRHPGRRRRPHRPRQPAAARGDDLMHRRQAALRSLRPVHLLPRRQHAAVLGAAGRTATGRGSGAPRGTSRSRACRRRAGSRTSTSTSISTTTAVLRATTR